jgi:hypothetical protein
MQFVAEQSEPAKGTCQSEAKSERSMAIVDPERKRADGFNQQGERERNDQIDKVVLSGTERGQDRKKQKQ